MFLEYTKKEVVLKITEVLKSATAQFIENALNTMEMAIAIAENQKTPGPVMFTWAMEILNLMMLDRVHAITVMVYDAATRNVSYLSQCGEHTVTATNGCSS